MNDFTTLNNFFDHIYVISLRRAIGRQEEIKKNLAGLHYDFFWGEDKQDHSIVDVTLNGIYDETMAVKNHRYHKTFSGGQICCAWSHRNVYKEILDKGYKKVLILEDDVIAHKDIEIISPLVFSELPANWDLLYLDYDKNEKNNVLKKYWYHIQKALGGLIWSHTMIENLYPKKFSEHLASAGFHDFSSSYAITSAAAAKLLKLQSPISFLADNLLATACTTKLVNGFIVRPKLFSQLSQGLDKQTLSFVDD